MASKSCLALSLFIAAGCGVSDDLADPVDTSSEDVASLARYSGRTFDVAHLPSSLAPGDIVRSGGAAVLVPRPGEGVSAEGLRADGGADELQVNVALDGTVTVTTGAPVVATQRLVEPSSAATAPQCSQHDYTLEGFRWEVPLRWYFQAGSTPNYLSVDFALSELNAGGHNITQEHNTCGRPDRVSASIDYVGRTTRGVNVTASFTCGDRDGVSVVAFHDFDAAHSQYLAATCNYTVQPVHGGQRTAVESDIRIARTEYTWWESGATCIPFSPEEYYSLEAVMTHERGHSFGLGHTAGWAQTMYEDIYACEKQDTTLGTGDMLGLEQLY